jgi:hypothetical protein
MATHIHRAVPLHAAFLYAMLPWEIFKMAMDSKPGVGLYHSQAKKRLTATHPKLEFSLTHSKHRTRQFLIATKILFSIPCISLPLYTLSPPRREGRGFKWGLAPGVFRPLQQCVCKTRPSRIFTDALRPEQRTRHHAFTPRGSRRMLARGSSSTIPGRDIIQASCGGSLCGFF